MRITDIISITELSRLLKKTRPTVYKYVSDFESGKQGNLPQSVRSLFQKIQSGTMPKKEIYAYCEYWFAGETASAFSLFGGRDKREKTTLQEVIELLKANEKKLDMEKLKIWIEQEIGK